MTTQITADKLIKAIAAARDKSSLMETIRDVTAGAAISDKVLESVEKRLAASGLSSAALSNIMSILKASAGLPEIMEYAEKLYSGVTRKGNPSMAARTGIKAYLDNQRGESLAEAMAAAYPVISDKEKQMAALKSLLTRAQAIAGEVKPDLTATLSTMIAKL